MNQLVPCGAAAAFAALAVSSLAPAQQWQQVSPASSPSARNSHALAFDIARGVNVLFGGQTGIGIGAGDHWEWDGTAWTQRTFAVAPSARWSHALTYDSRRMRLVLFGGFEQSSWSFRNDTWEFDGVAWTLRATAAAPSPRGYSGLAYDSQRGVTVLFGGYDGVGGLDDTWEWDGTAWSQRTTPAAPSPRRGMAMAFDSARNETVLFGGGVFNNASAETWTWNGTTWTQRTPAAAPSARWDTRMVFDISRGRAVLHGGADGGYTTDLGDSWEWNGGNWTQLVGGGPSARHGSAMGYDARKAQVLLFGGRDAGGFLGQTWSIAPSTNTNNNHAIRLDGVSGYGSTGGVGGLVGNSTWEAWIRLPSYQPGNVGFRNVLFRWGMYSHAAPIVNASTGAAGAGGASCPNGAESAAGALTPGVWHHVAAQYLPQPGPIVVYINGVEVARNNAGVTCSPYAGWQTLLGASGYTSITGFLAAEIDEARISNTVRYTSSFQPQRRFTPDAQTVGLWHFDEGSGSTALDASGNNRHFTLNGGFAWATGVDTSGPAATFATYGQGCAHSTGTALLGAVNGSTPRLNQTLAVRLTGLPLPSVFVPMAFLGYRNDTALGMSLPFSMGMYGMPPQCQQYVEPDMGLVFTLQNSGGYADWPIFVPNQPSLLGSPVFLQGLVFDWTLPYPLPAVSTNAAIATIGL